jgi:glycosyltransferase involved in cell wall biosynthesis
MKKIRVTMLGPSLYQQGGMATVENLIVDHRSETVEIQHLSTHEEGSALRRIQVFVIGVLRFCGQLLMNRTDVVHLHVSERGSVFRVGLLVFLAHIFSKPVIMHTHGSEFHIFYEGLSRLARGLVRLIFQNCAYVITLSQSWKQYYTTQCYLDPQKVLVMLNPVHLPAQLPDRQRSGQRPVRFVFLGRIGHRKGCFDVIQAVAQLPSVQRQQIEVLLAGDGEVEKAQALIDRSGLQQSIHLLGWINGETRDRLLKQADVFLLPSHNEGLPVSMVEAMAWGLPVIVSPVGGIPELVTHQKQGFLVTPGNVDEIAAAMQNLLMHDQRRLAMGKAARQQVNPLDIGQYHQTLSQLYESAISAARGQEAPVQPRPAQLFRGKA